MAQTKDELLNALDNISGPIETAVVRDLIESLIEYVETQALGQQLDVRFVNAAGDTISGDVNVSGGDVEFLVDSEGIILVDRNDATRHRLYVDTDSLLIETVA